jgi:hypothetical protein
MLSLIVSYGRRAAAQQEPVGSGALWQLEVSARQRILDQPSYLVLGARFRGEERPYGHLVADALRTSVMGCQRARRLMVPLAAESYRHGRADCLWIAAHAHAYPSFVCVDRSHLTHASRGVPVEIATVHFGPVSGPEMGSNCALVRILTSAAREEAADVAEDATDENQEGPQRRPLALAGNG